MAERLTLKRERAQVPFLAAASNPIASVIVDTGLSHLDGPFDYVIPASLDQQAQPGVRIRVRFARKLVDGWVVGRSAKSDFAGKLLPITSVVSPEVLLTPMLLEICQSVAERFGGSIWDVLRTAVPKRHAKIEALPSPKVDVQWESQELPRGYPRLPAFLQHLDRAPRAVWSFAPSRNPYDELAAVIQEVARQGRGVLVVLPDERSSSQLMAAFSSTDGICELRADLSPSERYRRYLRLSRGVDQVCIGTRAAAFAPMENLSLAIVWDDGDESHYEQRTPGWNSRDVLAIRSHLQGCALLIAGFNVSVDAARLIESNWAKEILPEISQRPNISASDDEPVRLTSKTWKVIKERSAVGPVLVSVARLGYRPALQCRKCFSPAVCSCGGRIGQELNGEPRCQLCGTLQINFTCPACGSTGYRSSVIGIERTVEEMGRAFPEVAIRHSTGERPLKRVPRRPMIVVSTQGVEPSVEGGYAAIVLLDAQAALMRSDMRAEEEARRRWFNTAALAGPDAPVIINADSAHPAVQALIRWSPGTAAQRELQERRALHLPPAWDLATIDLPTPDPSLVEALRDSAEVLGPLDHDGQTRYVARASHGLAPQIKSLMLARGARKAPPARVRVNPFTL